jgi:hypothetical protein
MKITWFIFLSLLLHSYSGLAQCTCPVVPFPSSPMPGGCEAVAMDMGIVSTASNTQNVDFTFDTFGKIKGGITISGSTLLRLKVPAKVILGVPQPCHWGLYMYIDNGGGATPANEWQSNTIYGTSGTKPHLDLMEVKVYNWCGTPCNTGTPQNFAASNLACIPIVHDVVTNIAGSCIPNVNGPGSYITNYNEYSFTVDYKIVPLPEPPAMPLSLRPGQYTITIHFYLVEE